MSNNQPNSSFAIFLPFVFLLPFVFAIILALVIPVAIAKTIKSRTRKVQEIEKVAVAYSQMPEIFQAIDEEEVEEIIEPETGGVLETDEPLTTEEIQKVLVELAKANKTKNPYRSAGRQLCSSLGLKPGNRAKLDSFVQFVESQNVSRSVWNQKTQQLSIYVN